MILPLLISLFGLKTALAVDFGPALHSTAETQENQRKKEALVAKQGISGTCLLLSNGAEMPCPTLTLNFKNVSSGDIFPVKTNTEGNFEAILPSAGRYALTPQSTHYEVFPAHFDVVAGEKNLIVKLKAR